MGRRVSKMTNLQRARTNGLRVLDRTDSVLGEHLTRRMGQATGKAAVQRGDINPEDVTFCWAALSRNSNEIG